MLDLKNAWVRAEGSTILHNVSFHLREGEILSILGESGAGKTTLLKAISGLIATEGDITVDHQVVRGPGERLVPGVEGVATVFQDHKLMHNRTVLENIAYPLRALIEEDQFQIAHELIDVLMLEKHSNHYPKQLSGGQKQRTGIARALAEQPKLLLLDEPFSHLDISLRDLVKAQILTYLKNEGITAVLVTHDPSDALAISDKTAVLQQGKLVQFGKTTDIYRSPATEYVMSSFSLCNFWDIDTFKNDFPFFENTTSYIRVGIRVEDLYLSRSTANSLPVTVQQSIYQGSHYLIQAITQSDVKVYFRHPSLLHRRSKVLLAVNGHDIRYF